MDKNMTLTGCNLVNDTNIQKYKNQNEFLVVSDLHF